MDLAKELISVVPTCESLLASGTGPWPRGMCNSDHDIAFLGLADRSPPVVSARESATPHNGEFEHYHKLGPRLVPSSNDPQSSLAEFTVSKEPIDDRVRARDSDDNCSKFSIMIRLALPLASIALTCYQLPYVMTQRFAQSTRSLLAVCVSLNVDLLHDLSCTDIGRQCFTVQFESRITDCDIH